MKYISILVVLASIALSGCSNHCCSDCQQAAPAAPSSDNKSVDQLINDANDAFLLAESEIFKTEPKPDDAPLGPDPDPKKCACGGSGQIVHGDGHVTPCPFHPVELIMKKY